MVEVVATVVDVEEDVVVAEVLVADTSVVGAMARGAEELVEPKATASLGALARGQWAAITSATAASRSSAAAMYATRK